MHNVIEESFCLHYIVVTSGIISKTHVSMSKFSVKVFPDGLMDVIASKNISSCSVPYTALPMKTDSHFQPTLS